MHIVSFIQSKGGVGKSLSAVSLAAGLAAAGESTVLVDLDNVNQTASNGFPHESTIYDALGARFVAPEVVRPDLSLYAADYRMATGGTGLLERLRGALTRLALSGEYAYCVLDAPAGWSELPQLAAEVADSIYLPVNAAQEALESALMLSRWIAAMPVASVSSGKTRPVRFLMTMYQDRPDARMIAEYQADWSMAPIPHSASARYLALSSQTCFDPPVASRARRLKSAYASVASEVRADAREENHGIRATARELAVSA